MIRSRPPLQFRQQTIPVAERAKGMTERCTLRLMGTGELEHVNYETKHSSTQQKTLSLSSAVITVVVLIREEVHHHHPPSAAYCSTLRVIPEDQLHLK